MSSFRNTATTGSQQNSGSLQASYPSVTLHEEQGCQVMSTSHQNLPGYSSVVQQLSHGPTHRTGSTYEQREDQEVEPVIETRITESLPTANDDLAEVASVQRGVRTDTNLKESD